MKFTPKEYRSLEAMWQERVTYDDSTPVYSASVEQGAISNEFFDQCFEYVPCPICGEDKYTVLHKRTMYAKSRWKDTLLDIFIRIVGRKAATILLSLLFRRRIDFFRKGYRVVQCVHCGFIYRNPSYSERNMQIAYNKNNYLGFLSGKYSQTRLNLYKYILDKIDFDARTVDFGRRRLLDIGCGFGLLLNYMRRMNWDCYGLDFASDCIEFGKKEFGLNNIDVGNLEGNTFEKNFFDAVTLISVAAHLDRPINMFEKIHKVLRPGGLLLIWTVNAGSLMHKHLLGHWRGFSLNHLVFFDSRSMIEALEKAGFSQVDLEYDVRLFNALKKQRMIPEEHLEYFEQLMRKENLAEMLLVVAINGE